MLKINLSFLSNSTNNWSQSFIDSVSLFGGKAFRWIQETHKNEFIGYGMFAAVTTVSFLTADRIATILSPSIDTSFTKDGTQMTSDRKLFKGLFLNGLITGGATYTANLIYSSLSRHKLPQAIMLATAVAACALRYFVEVKREEKRGKTEKKNQLNALKNKLDNELKARRAQQKAQIDQLKADVDLLIRQEAEDAKLHDKTPRDKPQQLVISTLSEKGYCSGEEPTVLEDKTGSCTHHATPRHLNYEERTPINIGS